MDETTRGRRPSLGRLALLAVVLAAAAAALVWYLQRDAADAVVLEEGQELVPVMRGDLVNQVTSSGSVVFPNRETLTFGSQGAVGAVLVSEGDVVAEGQELARLDDDAFAQLERGVAQAELDLEQAQEALADLLAPPANLTVVEARAAVAKAELAVQQAREALADTETPFSENEIAVARLDAANAADALADARADLDFTAAEQDRKVQDAFDALVKAQADYQQVVTNYLGLTLGFNEFLMTPEELFAAHGIDPYALYSDARLEDAVGALLPLDGSAAQVADDPATPWDEFTVYRWMTLYPGGIHGTCEGIQPGPDDLCVLQEMERAWSPLDAARNALDAAENAATKATSAAERAVEQAEDAVAKADERLEEVFAAVDDLEVRVKLREVDVAEAKLADARGSLADLDQPPDPATVTLREAQVRANETALEGARERLAAAVITAPFPGVVSAVGAAAGDAVNAGTAVVEIVDPSVAVVDAVLDEIDVLSVQEGAQAIIALDGLPGAGLPGQVISIASTGDNQQGVVTYPVEIQMRVPPVLQLREGLSATATIVLQQELDVLLIPSTSIAGTIAEPTVLVSVEGEVMERPVTLGASDGFWVVVTEGVEEGDELVSTGGGAGGFNFGGFGPPGGLNSITIGPGGQGAGNLTPEQRQALREQFRQQGGLRGQGPRGGNAAPAGP